MSAGLLKYDDATVPIIVFKPVDWNSCPPELSICSLCGVVLVRDIYYQKHHAEHVHGVAMG